MIHQAAQLANTKDPSTGQYLFGGTASSQTPFTTTTDANGNVTGVTYNGNSSVNQVEIGEGVMTSVDVPGANTSGSGARGLITDSQSGADLFNHLIALRNDLTPATRRPSPAPTARICRTDENKIFTRSATTVRCKRGWTTAATVASNSTQTLNTMISNTSSADMVQTMVQLNQTQTAYQAALQSGAKIMQLSILNYIG